MKEEKDRHDKFVQSKKNKFIQEKLEKQTH